ncbi:transcriptional regulator, XRE family [Caldicellulosiruptor saccharolyticus DSM 8903]|uniref:Transcriptional regulator, XRE family n=1 Tax=Caldicellulosiruptor saccharolyticus (strain ATCC 43494 / DSM 8903 / Tp8T 6331) TaxID=351627 RepID=A4XLK8_CALS8|nr:helix-turn-helix transcriptional regulator [Caldicellulosiruptor saccharolyticus]ABP67793.1 transcriptional regulator, XRE family [Caldicellulosiruptor saccharolyticus DSM 8903]
MLPEHEILKYLGLQIRVLREWAGLKQTELAKKLHISQTTLARYENGELRPPIETLLRIADFFDVSIDALLGRKNSHKDPLSILQELRIQKEQNVLENEIKELLDKTANKEELRLLLRQLKSCSPKTIKRLIKIIKAIEEEEQKNE